MTNYEGMTGRIVAIMGGGDWYDASVEHLIVPAEVNLQTEKDAYDKWYRDVYSGARNRGEEVLYITFAQWLKELGSRDTIETEVEEFWE